MARLLQRFFPSPTLLLLTVLCHQTRAESCSDAALCSILDDKLCMLSEVQEACKTKCGTCGSKDRYCPDITISHGDTTTTASPPHKVGTVANFVCDTGYKRTGVQSVTCLKSGKWSDQPPLCTAISCERDRDKLEEGRTCQASCKRGDVCRNNFHTCECDDWCGKSCFNITNIQCKLLSSPRNGFMKSKGRRYGLSVTYSCKPGYVLIGSSTRRCRSDRKWSGSNPFCVPMGACGFTMKQEEKAHKVVHGNDAKKGDWPWQVLIFDSDQYSVNQVYRKSVFGGGSLIDEGWVLTAAHVFDEEYPNNVITKIWKNTFILAFGMTAYVKRGHAIPEHIQIFEPKDVFMHPKFDPKSLDYDVALVRIGNKLKRGDNEKFVTDDSAPSGKVTFSQNVRPVCLPCMKGGILNKADVWRKYDKTRCDQKEKSIFPSFADVGSPLMVTGFGLTDLATKERAGNLQEGALKVVDPMTCGKDIPAIKLKVRNARYTSRMFCASGGNESRRVDSCYGDSGGPAVKEVTRIKGSYRITYWLQVGIVSWGLGCAERYHGYYTSVPSVMQWVWKTLDDAKKAVWGDWSQWSVCDVTCGSGNMKRTRICAGATECGGSPSETAPCNTRQCPGVWESWGLWVPCSASCGGGKMSRLRVCAGPGDCTGNANDEKECKTESCPGVWSGWGLWGSCDVSCGGGEILRYRVCFGTGECAGDEKDAKECETESCPVWTNWTLWTQCFVPCGGGKRSRSRICQGQGECAGNANEVQSCNTEPCPGIWSDWSPWTRCSAMQCSERNTSRLRFCFGPQQCVGSASQQKACSDEFSLGFFLFNQCAGVWSEWREEGGCSRTCGGGSMLLQRQCKGPGGCIGSGSDVRPCATETCSTVLPKSCNGVKLRSAKSRSDTGGVFSIDIPQVGATEVYCDLTTDGGHWTVFQRRTEDGLSFDRDWKDYVHGFGDVRGEFWLGLEAVYQLTKTGQYEMRIDLIASRARVPYYANYRSFKIGPSSDYYRLSLSGYSGSATDALADPPAASSKASNGEQFSTRDKGPYKRCGKNYGGWWSSFHCSYASLNAPPNERAWFHQQGKGWLSVEFSEMKFRPRQ